MALVASRARPVQTEQRLLRTITRCTQGHSMFSRMPPPLRVERHPAATRFAPLHAKKKCNPPPSDPHALAFPQPCALVLPGEMLQFVKLEYVVHVSSSRSTCSSIAILQHQLEGKQPSSCNKNSGVLQL